MKTLNLDKGRLHQILTKPSHWISVSAAHQRPETQKSKFKCLVYWICNNRFNRFHHSEKWSRWPRRTEAVRDGRGEVLEVLMMTMGKLVIGLNDWPTRTASNLQQSHLDLTSCQLFSGCSLDCVSFSYLLDILGGWCFYFISIGSHYDPDKIVECLNDSEASRPGLWMRKGLVKMLSGWLWRCLHARVRCPDWLLLAGHGVFCPSLSRH